MIDHFALWFKQPLAVLDVETTGFSPSTGDRIVEIAAVLLVEMKIVDVWHSYVNPGRPIPADASRIHGIYDEDVALAPLFRAQAKSFLAFCDGAVPCAYNESFDRSFILAELPGWTALHEWSRWLDPLTFVRSVDRFARAEGGGKVSNSLSAAAARYGVELSGAHGALADATAAAQILAAIHTDMPRCTASELIRRQGNLARAYDERWERSGGAKR